MKKKVLSFLLLLLGMAQGTMAQQAYAVLSDDGQTVTFYYDDQKDSRSGVVEINNETVGYGENPYGAATSAVFDDSFADYRPTSTAYWFYTCSSLRSIEGLKYLNTEEVTDMSLMFSECSLLRSIDVQYLNTTKVKFFDSMFSGCASLTSLDLSNFSTESAISLWTLFGWCEHLTDIDVSGFKTDNVEYMRYMFYGCHSMASIDVSGFNTDNVTDMCGMFGECSLLTSIDVSHFNTEKVTNMSVMFGGCSSLTSLDVSNFNTANVVFMGEMFSGCKGLTSLDLLNFNTKKVVAMWDMFSGCSGLTNLDLSKFNTENVVNMRGMFNGCTSLKTIYVGNYWSLISVNSDYGTVLFDDCTQLVGGQGTAYDANHIDYTYAHIDLGAEFPGYLTYKSTPTNGAYAVLSDDGNTVTFYYDKNKTSHEGEMQIQTSPGDDFYRNVKKAVFDASFADCHPASTGWWFYSCSKLESIDGLNYLNTGDVTDMTGMFGNCSGLASIDVSNFDTRNVTSMMAMFSGCSGLASLDVSKFATSNVTDMSSMFGGCSSLTSLDVSNFDTGNVTDIGSIFFDCSSLTSLDLSHFDTGKVTDMSYMFDGCSKLTSLDLSNFDTGNVTNMTDMFYGCSGLTSLDVSHFDTGNVTDMSFMFHSCSGLTSIDVSNFDTRNVTDMGYMFYGCSGLTSIDVSNFDTSNVTDMSSMFSHCSGLTTMYCNDTWECAPYGALLFSECRNLFGYNWRNVNVDYAKPIADGGYFTPKTETANAVGSVYWWTYYTDVRNVKADDNTTVYTATLNADGTEVVLNEVTDKIVPRGQAVIMKSTTGEPLLYTSTETGTGDFSTNALQGTQREKATSDIDGTVYVLAAEGGKLGFYRYTGEKLAANKVFLVLNGSNARSISIVGNEETGINDVAGQPTEVTAYDLQGRRISEPQKGLYIVNGKKMVKH